MFRIAVLAGDGIGPEVMAEALRVLRRIERRFGLEFEFSEYLFGGCAYDVYGQPLPDDTLSGIKASNAILLGAVGGPKWDVLPPHLRPERGALLPLRKLLGLYANVRPIYTFEPLLSCSPVRPEALGKGVDIIILRELIGGLYFGEPKERIRLGDGYRAVDTMAYTSEEIERIIRLAFEMAMKRRKKVTSVDKANVLETSRLWREIATEVGKEYPDVELEHMYIDNCTMQLILHPSRFDVVVTENTFGDIITDEASTLAGSIGMLPSASLGTSGLSLYEPIHGSAPDIAGKSVANPLATILSTAMMLRYSFEHEEAARCIEGAVLRVLEKGYRTADILQPGTTRVSTREMGDLVTREI